MKSNTTISYWLGDDASLQTFLDASEQMRGSLPAEDYELPRIMEIEDGIAVISIKGSLTSADNWWNSFMGITSYNEIRNAIVMAVNDESVTRIMLDIDSGGGHASGVAELAEFIKKATNHKPIDAYVSGTAFSAAYWIASAASTISGTKMAEAGSIGVIAIVQTYEKALKDRKISTHVFRGGVHKALGNGYEALTGEAKELIQAKIANMATNLEASRLMTYNATAMIDNGLECMKQATMAKYFVTEAACSAADDCTRIFAGYGYSMEYPAQRYFRDTRFLLSGGGTHEVIQTNLARWEGL